MKQLIMRAKRGKLLTSLFSRQEALSWPLVASFRPETNHIEI